MAEPSVVVGLVAVAVLPPLVFLYLVRNNEKYRKEPYKAVFSAFIWGIVTCYLLYLAFRTQTEMTFEGAGMYHLVTRYDALYAGIVVLLPLLQEVGKGVGLGLTRRHMDEVEDGIIYGAAIGLGFAGTENLLFGLAVAGQGLPVAQVVAQMASSIALHTAASAFLGFGYSVAIRRPSGRLQALLPYLVFAVFMHGLYLAMLIRLEWYGYMAALLMAGGIAALVQVKVRQLDAKTRPAVEAEAAKP